MHEGRFILGHKEIASDGRLSWRAEVDSFPPKFSPLTARQVAQDIAGGSARGRGRVWLVGRYSQSGTVCRLTTY
jgi:hypothetical protein